MTQTLYLHHVYVEGIQAEVALLFLTTMTTCNQETLDAFLTLNNKNADNVPIVDHI